MKKHLNPLMIALMAIAMLATTCGPEEPHTDPPDRPVPFDPSVIIATNVINSNSSIETVKAFVYACGAGSCEEEIIATGDYKNDGFTLGLPKIVPDRFLYEEFENDEWITVSDPEAKVGETYLYAFSNSGKRMGEFYYFGVNNRIWVDAFYVYADRNFTVKGKEEWGRWTEEYDLSFKKGWNIIYSVEEMWGYTWTLTTQKPAGLIMDWVFDEDYYWDAPLVRFKKEGAYENCQAIGVAHEYGWEVYAYFGSDAGLSSYYRIPSRNYHIMYYDENWERYSPMNYDFEKENMYTVVCSDNDGELYFYVVKDDGNKSSKPKNLLKNRRPIVAKKMANK